MKRKTVQTKYDVPVRQAFRWASEQKFCEAELHEIFAQKPSSMAHEGNHICLHRFSFIYVVCPAKLDHTSRCKSGHGNRQ